MFKGLINNAGPIGIDLCDDAVRLLQLGSVQGTLCVLASARIDLAPLGITHAPDDPAPDELVRALARRLHAGGFSGKRCHITLPDRSLTTRTARLPVMPDAELANAAALDAPGHLGLADCEGGAEIGWIRTGDIFQGDERRYELVYFGTPSERLERLAYALEGAGLEPLAMEPRFVSLTRATTRFLRRTADADIVQLCIDVCEQHSDVLITRGDGLVFAKVIPLGSDEMNGAVAKRLGLDNETVTEIRRQRMQPSGSDDVDERIERAIFDSVRPTLSAIAHEAGLCLRHYSVTFRGARPTRVLLSGPVANEPGFADVVRDQLGMETVTADPFEGVCTKSVIGGGRYGPDWTAAMGIASRDMLKRASPRNRNQRRTAAPSSREGRAA
ncbi:MAG: pilus assembly protein PilM [Planctomycetota bacterium]